MKYLIIYEYIEELNENFSSKIELDEILNIVSRDEKTIINFKDGTIAEYDTECISLYFK